MEDKFCCKLISSVRAEAFLTSVLGWSVTAVVSDSSISQRLFRCITILLRGAKMLNSARKLRNCGVRARPSRGPRESTFLADFREPISEDGELDCAGDVDFIFVEELELELGQMQQLQLRVEHQHRARERPVLRGEGLRRDAEVLQQVEAGLVSILRKRCTRSPTPSASAPRSFGASSGRPS